MPQKPRARNHGVGHHSQALVYRTNRSDYPIPYSKYLEVMNHTAATCRRVTWNTTKSVRWSWHSSSCSEYLVAARGRRAEDMHSLRAHLKSLTVANNDRTSPTARTEWTNRGYLLLPFPVSTFTLLDIFSLNCQNHQTSKISWHSANRQSPLVLQERQKNN